MQSSYSVIKSDNVSEGTKRTISTSYSQLFKMKRESLDSNQGDLNNNVVNKDEIVKNYENIGFNIVEQAKRQSNDIIVESYEKAKIIEKEAYEKGYSQGLENGYEDGKNEAIEKFIPQAEKESKEIIVMAESILKYAKGQYEEYIISKRKEILELSVAIAEQVLKRGIEEKDWFISFLEQGISEVKGEKNVILKCNPIDEEIISNKLEEFKTRYSIRGEIFILPDPEIPIGNVVVEKESGVLEVGIDVALNIIRDEIVR